METWSFPNAAFDILSKIGKRMRKVDASCSSASELDDGWTEDSGLWFQNASDVDGVAEEICGKIQTLGIPGICEVELQKWLAGEEILIKRIYPLYVSEWAPAAPPVIEPISLPSRIDYLTDLAHRYYLTCGMDVVSVLSEQDEQEEFLQNLPEDDKERFHDAYQRIIAEKDNEWLMAWLTEDGNITNEKAQVVYFLVILDRINEVGFSGDDYVELVDWKALM